MFNSPPPVMYNSSNINYSSQPHSSLPPVGAVTQAINDILELENKKSQVGFDRKVSNFPTTCNNNCFSSFSLSSHPNNEKFVDNDFCGEFSVETVPFHKKYSWTARYASVDQMSNFKATVPFLNLPNGEKGENLEFLVTLESPQHPDLPSTLSYCEMQSEFKNLYPNHYVFKDCWVTYSLQRCQLACQQNNHIADFKAKVSMAVYTTTGKLLYAKTYYNCDLDNLTISFPVPQEAFHHDLQNAMVVRAEFEGSFSHMIFVNKTKRVASDKKDLVNVKNEKKQEKQEKQDKQDKQDSGKKQDKQDKQNKQGSGKKQEKQGQN